MAETKDYTYEGNVVLSLGKTNCSAETNCSKQEIVINNIQNMIPINAICTINGNDTTLTAYMDYATNSVNLPQETISQLSDPNNFKDLILEYFANKKLEAERQYAEMYPPMDAESLKNNESVEYMNYIRNKGNRQ